MASTPFLIRRLLVEIVAIGAYVPPYRLGSETSGWNSAPDRSVVNGIPNYYLKAIPQTAKAKIN